MNVYKYYRNDGQYGWPQSHRYWHLHEISVEQSVTPTIDFDRFLGSGWIQESDVIEVYQELKTVDVMVAMMALGKSIVWRGNKGVATSGNVYKIVKTKGVAEYRIERNEEEILQNMFSTKIEAQRHAFLEGELE